MYESVIFLCAIAAGEIASVILLLGIATLLREVA